MERSNCEQYNPTFNYPDGVEGVKCDCLYRIDNDWSAAFCKRKEYYRCVKEVSTMPIELSHSLIGNFMTCPWLCYLRDIRGIVTRPAYLSAALKAGKLWDCAKQKILGVDINLGAIVDEYEIDNVVIAKVRALKRAYETLGIKVESGYETQASFNNLVIAEDVYREHKVPVTIKGFYDRKYATYFTEDKLSSKPDKYLDVFQIQSQVGTYFLADPTLEYCIMEVVRTPDLKFTGKFKEESPEAHEQRTYDDIISRPSFYFIGWDRDKKTYGKKFYRSEFDVEEIKNRFRSISILIHDCQGFDGWYKNPRSCTTSFGECEMKPICRYNNMSETQFTIREKKEL